MKIKTVSIIIFCFVFCHAKAQILCIHCYDQNTPVSTGVTNLLLNGGFENGCLTGSYFCPNSSGYSCDLTNWTCTGGGNLTYAAALDNTIASSIIIEGLKAAYFGNYYCNPCSSTINDTSCISSSGCTVDGIPAGFPLNTYPGYGGNTGISLQQTVTGLTPGNIYVLEFWAGGESNGLNFAKNGLFAVDVGFGNTFFRDRRTPNMSDIGTRYIIEFYATSFSHTIKFTNWGHICFQCTELVLDDVRLYTLAELSNSVPSCLSILNTVASDDTTICKGECTTVYANTSGGTAPFTYSWTPDIGNTAGPFSVCPSSTTHYTVQVTDSTGTSVTDSVIVTVNTAPALITSGSVTIFGGDSTLLSVSGASSYSWSPCMYLDVCAADSVTAFPPVTTTYTVTGFDSTGCASTDSITVSVDSVPQFIFSLHQHGFYITTYPNPFNEGFLFHIYNSSSETISLFIYDVTGRDVENYPDVNENTVVGNNLKRGIYFIEVKQGTNLFRLRAVKE